MPFYTTTTLYTQLYTIIYSYMRATFVPTRGNRCCDRHTDSHTAFATATRIRNANDRARDANHRCGSHSHFQAGALCCEPEARITSTAIRIRNGSDGALDTNHRHGSRSTTQTFGGRPMLTGHNIDGRAPNQPML